MPVIVADTGPLNYLAWIEAAEILPNLYGRILIPSAVWEELSHPKTPRIVRNCLGSAPAWLEVASLKQTVDPALAHLGRGEQEAITLSIERRADLLLIDERDGTRAASQCGLTVTGTLGVLDQAAARKWIDLPTAFTKLEQTSFRCPRVLMAALVEEDKRRKRT